MPAHKKQVRGKMTPKATKKVVSAKKSFPHAKPPKPVRVEPQPPAKGSGDVGAHVRRLTGEVETLKAELRKRPGGTGPEASSRRDLDKILADRLARLDEKIESLWGRVADLEEHFEGEGGGRTREPDFDETPDRDFYER
jgi:hypothetical protein